MFKKIFLALLLVAVIAGGLAGIKALQIKKMISQGESFVMPPAVVSTANATADSWETVLTAIGSVTAVQGVTLTAETPGQVERIFFDSGDKVATGDVLVQLDISQETAQLRALEASANLAAINLKRYSSLLAQQSTARAEYDKAQAEHRQLVAEMDAIRAVIAKKTVRAPFAGTLGLRQVNLGQNLGESDPIASLQRLDQVHVEFVLPQQQVHMVRTGNMVRVTSDALPGQTVGGLLKAIEPLADSATRTVRMQAVLDNPDELLRPGMFVNVGVVLPEKRDVVVIPATAVLSAAYGSSVFVVEAANATNATNAPGGLVLRQQFVKLGERRGDFVTVQGGVNPGDTVVSTGVFKYRHGQSVVEDNTLAPGFELAPRPENS
ncbi:MAG: efflux RND transporter periplasmic adaptor subunit [Deltaproteobacteria bacterium]|nr:efflux RND transporter periplasmic adaptor subunit [Deltaproteobacteria bacterium]